MNGFGRHVLELDCATEAARIGAWLRATTAQSLHRRGLVVAISGGIDPQMRFSLYIILKPSAERDEGRGRS